MAEVAASASAGGEFRAQASFARYTTVAIILHWVIAAAIIFQIWSGWSAHEGMAAGGDGMKAAADLLQTHKAVGLTVLWLSVLRLGWRLAHPAPPLPSEMPGWQKFASNASHFLFYCAMIGGPLTGWLLVSTNTEYDIDTLWFGLFTVPHLPIAVDLDPSAKDQIYGLTINFHALIAYGTLALLVLHVGAALKHHIVDRDATLSKMAPMIKPRSGFVGAPIRRIVAIGRRLLSYGLYALAAVGLIAAGYAYLQAQRITQPPVIEAIASGGGAGSGPVIAAPGSVDRWAPVAAESSVVAMTTANGAEMAITLAWTAEIAFDPDNLEGSTVSVIFDMTQLDTPDANNRTEMKKPVWFDVAGHPTARFTAERFEAMGEGAYIAHGALTIKGVTKDFSLPFTLRIDGDRAEMTAQAQIMRLDFNVGEGKEPSFSNPPYEVGVDIKLIADRVK